MQSEDRLLEAAKQIKIAVGDGDWTNRAESDLLKMEKDLRGIAAVAKDRQEPELEVDA